MVQDAGYRGCPCWAPQEQEAGSASPVHCVEVSLQEAVVHSTLAELQVRLGVVVHIVDTHLLHDPKPPLREREDPVSTPPVCGFLVTTCFPSCGKVASNILLQDKARRKVPQLMWSAGGLKGRERPSE